MPSKVCEFFIPSKERTSWLWRLPEGNSENWASNTFFPFNWNYYVCKDPHLKAFKGKYISLSALGRLLYWLRLGGKDPTDPKSLEKANQNGTTTFSSEELLMVTGLTDQSASCNWTACSKNTHVSHSCFGLHNLSRWLLSSALYIKFQSINI